MSQVCTYSLDWPGMGEQDNIVLRCDVNAEQLLVLASVNGGIWITAFAVGNPLPVMSLFMPSEARITPVQLVADSSTNTAYLAGERGLYRIENVNRSPEIRQLYALPSSDGFLAGFFPFSDGFIVATDEGVLRRLNSAGQVITEARCEAEYVHVDEAGITRLPDSDTFYVTYGFENVIETRRCEDLQLQERMVPPGGFGGEAIFAMADGSLAIGHQNGGAAVRAADGKWHQLPSEESESKLLAACPLANAEILLVLGHGQKYRFGANGFSPFGSQGLFPMSIRFLSGNRLAGVDVWNRLFVADCQSGAVTRVLHKDQTVQAILGHVVADGNELIVARVENYTIALIDSVSLKEVARWDSDVYATGCVPWTDTGGLLVIGGLDARFQAVDKIDGTWGPVAEGALYSQVRRNDEVQVYGPDDSTGGRHIVTVLRDGRTDVFHLDAKFQVKPVCEVPGTFQHVCMPRRGLVVLARKDGSGVAVSVRESTQSEVQFDVPGGVTHITGAGGFIVATSATHTRGFDENGRQIYEFAGLSRGSRQLALSDDGKIIVVRDYPNIAYWTR